jgi:hypothetical protein
MIALRANLPMRPKPLIPTFAAISFSSFIGAV